MRIPIILITILLLAGPAHAWQVVGSGVSSGSTPVTASFDFTAESTSDPWTNSNWSVVYKTDINDTPRIKSGIGVNVVTPSSGDYLILYWDTDTFADKQYSSVKINDIVNVNDISGPAVRVQSSFSCYVLSIRDSARLRLYEYTSGSYAQLGSDITGLTLANDDIITLKANGSTLQAFVNGSQVGTDFTDTSYSSGNVGILWDYWASSFETWGGGEW